MPSVAPVLCPACGAKLPQGLRRCLRCGETLAREEAPPASAARRWLGEKRGQIYIAATLLSIAVLAVFVIRQAAAPSTPEQPAPSTTSVPREAAARASAVPSRPDPVASSFIDARRDGNFAYAAGNFDAAIKQYEQAIAANPKDADSMNNLGQVLVRTNRAAEAIPYFERAVALNNGKWAYHFNLARALGLTESWSRAVAEYRLAAAIFPDDYPTQYNLALALHRLGDEEAAIAEFRKAIALAPEEPTFHLSLAMSLEKLNKRREAVESYERYLQLVPSGPDAEKVRQRVQELKAAQVPVAPLPSGDR